MKKNSVLVVVATLFILTSYAQGVTIGSNIPPDNSAVLDLQSVNGGFLLPRMSTAQRNAIVSPANGLQVYNTTDNCVQVYMPLSGWRDLLCDCPNPPSAVFTSPGSVSQNFPAAFQATQSGLTYSWTFQGGNPGTSNAQNPSVTWSAPGTYLVTLTVTDLLGCTNTSSGNVTVTSCPPPGQNSITFVYTGTVQTWTVPANCASVITIDVYGAGGGMNSYCGNNPGGRGARMQGDFTNLNPGDVLNIVVGQRGTDNSSGNSSNNAASGGGGSFVWNTSGTQLLIAAGGGGGGAICTSGGDPNFATGRDASTSTTGTYETRNINAGGTNGADGTGQGAGKGWNSVQSNPAGDNSASPNGGYGGGGATSGTHSGGGGGGYSGGGARPYTGNPASGGGGGGSFNGGTNQTNQAGIQTGNGTVVISW